MKGSYADKRDANEAAIIARFREFGCRVIQQPRAAGFDLLVLVPDGAALVVEVKNPERGWQYTESEADLLAWCAANGHEYRTVVYPADVGELLKVTA